MHHNDNYVQFNSETWDRWVDEGILWGQAISHESFMQAKANEWSVLLTPQTPVPKSWFPPMQGSAVLGLACGGGQQMPIFSALGAHCTVFDNSKRQLESEQMVAEREGYAINIVKGDMTQPLPFADESFDLIFHPVSNCYVENVYPIWRECFRVLKKGGILMAGMTNDIVFLFNDYNTLVVENPLPYNPLKDARVKKLLEEEDGGMQFSHPFEEQIGGQMQAGFIVTHLFDDYDNEEGSRLNDFTPSYYASRAVKPLFHPLTGEKL